MARTAWRGARAVGCVATVLMAVVGCTTVTDGTPGADTGDSPGLPGVGVRVGLGVGGDIEQAGVAASAVADHAGRGPGVRVVCHQQQRGRRQGERLRRRLQPGRRHHRASRGPRSTPSITAPTRSKVTATARCPSSCVRRSTRTTTPPATWRRPSARTPGPTSSISGSISSTTPRPKPSSVAGRLFESADVQRYVLCDDKLHRTAR